MSNVTILKSLKEIELHVQEMKGLQTLFGHKIEAFEESVSLIRNVLAEEMEEALAVAAEVAISEPSALTQSLQNQLIRATTTEEPVSLVNVLRAQVDAPAVEEVEAVEEVVSLADSLRSQMREVVEESDDHDDYDDYDHDEDEDNEYPSEDDEVEFEEDESENEDYEPVAPVSNPLASLLRTQLAPSKEQVVNASLDLTTALRNQLNNVTPAANVVEMKPEVVAQENELSNEELVALIRKELNDNSKQQIASTVEEMVTTSESNEDLVSKLKQQMLTSELRKQMQI